MLSDNKLTVEKEWEQSRHNFIALWEYYRSGADVSILVRFLAVVSQVCHPISMSHSRCEHYKASK